jgi:chromosome partitioning protein
LDFDPQCNLSIAAIGSQDFSKCLEISTDFPYGKTIRSFAYPYFNKNEKGKIYVSPVKQPPHEGRLDIIPGDFWLNNFSDYLNVGTDVVGGAGLYRFLLPSLLAESLEKQNNKKYDYLLIDLPPSFNTLVRSALYCSDYFLVPCTPDLFSAYCVGLIGEVLPTFIIDWQQGTSRFMRSDKYDLFIPTKGQPKFGGWIFNGFDTRRKPGDLIASETGADKAQFKKIHEAIQNDLLPKLKDIQAYNCVENFVPDEPVIKIEDLNVMAPDSIVQNIPIKYLSEAKPTRDIMQGTWAKNQRDLMARADSEYDKLADYIISNFHLPKELII